MFFFFFCKLEELTDQDNIKEAVKCIEKHFGCSEDIANQVFYEYKKQIYAECKRIENENPLTPEQIAYNNAIAKELLNKPQCPICGSTNLSKFTMAKKAVKIAVFGIYGMGDNGKTWKCNNCNSRF